MDELKAGGGSASARARWRRLRETFASGRASEDETARHDPRASAPRPASCSARTRAVGVHVAEEHLDPASPMITLATAHPAKFPDAVEDATGMRPPLPNAHGRPV